MLRNRLATIGVIAALAMALPTAAFGVTLPEETEVDLTASPAPVGTMVGGQTLVAVAGIGASSEETAIPTVGQVNCSADNSGDYAGERTSGQASGSFRYRALSVCSNAMVELDVYVQLLKNGSGQDNSGHATCRACPAVTTSNKTFSCSSCNGTWRLQSTHVFTLPAGFVLVDYDAGRCSIASAVQVTCVVKSHKVRI